VNRTVSFENEIAPLNDRVTTTRRRTGIIITVEQNGGRDVECEAGSVEQKTEAT